MNALIKIASIGIVLLLAGCASTRRCEPSDKSDYCEDLRRGVHSKAAPSPAKGIYRPSERPEVQSNPRYKPNVYGD